MEGSHSDVEERIRNYLTTFQKSMGWDEERMEDFGERRREMVEEKSKEKVPRESEQDKGKKVRFAEEERPEEMHAQSTDEQDVMSRLEEVRTGRGSAGLARGR